MNLAIKSEVLGGRGDHRWLYSRHAVENSATGTLNVAGFTPVNGVIKSGTPVTKNTSTGLIDAYTDGASQTLYGFVLNDTDASANTPVAIVWQGRIRTQFLPVEGFVAPTGPTQFVFD